MCPPPHRAGPGPGRGVWGAHPDSAEDAPGGRGHPALSRGLPRARQDRSARPTCEPGSPVACRDWARRGHVAPSHPIRGTVRCALPPGGRDWLRPCRGARGAGPARSDEGASRSGACEEPRSGQGTGGRAAAVSSPRRGEATDTGGGCLGSRAREVRDWRGTS